MIGNQNKDRKEKKKGEKYVNLIFKSASTCVQTNCFFVLMKNLEVVKMAGAYLEK